MFMIYVLILLHVCKGEKISFVSLNFSCRFVWALQLIGVFFCWTKFKRLVFSHGETNIVARLLYSISSLYHFQLFGSFDVLLSDIEVSISSFSTSSAKQLVLSFSASQLWFHLAQAWSENSNQVYFNMRLIFLLVSGLGNISFHVCSIQTELTISEFENFAQLFSSKTSNRFTRAADLLGSDFTASDEYLQLLSITKGKFLQLQLSTQEMTSLERFLENALSNPFKLVYVADDGSVAARDPTAHLWQTILDS